MSKKAIKIKSRRGSIFISSMITLLLIGILSGGVFAINSSMISLSNQQKENLYIGNALLSEVNYYSSLKTNLIENKEYVIQNDGVDINMSIEIIQENDNYIEIKIKASNVVMTREKTIKLTKKEV